MRASQIALALLLTGCIHMQRAPHRLGRLAASAPPEVCSKLATKVLWLNLTSIVTGGIGGAASGATSIAGDNKPALYSLSAGAAVFSITGMITGYLATSNAAKFTKECP